MLRGVGPVGVGGGGGGGVGVSQTLYNPISAPRSVWVFNKHLGWGFRGLGVYGLRV